MGDKIRTAIEIAMEKAEKLGGLSKNEKEKLEIEKKIEPILSRFFKGELDPDGLWKELREEKKNILKEFQTKLIDSITMGLSLDELKRRKNAVLALENLKKNPDTAYVEKLLNSLEVISLNAKKEKDSFYDVLKSQFENNPNLLVRQVDSGGKKMLVRLSVEEAINQNDQWKDFLSEHEKKNTGDFSDCLEKIKEELGI